MNVMLSDMQRLTDTNLEASRSFSVKSLSVGLMFPAVRSSEVRHSCRRVISSSNDCMLFRSALCCSRCCHTDTGSTLLPWSRDFSNSTVVRAAVTEQPQRHSAACRPVKGLFCCQSKGALCSFREEIIIMPAQTMSLFS